MYSRILWVSQYVQGLQSLLTYNKLNKLQDFLARCLFEGQTLSDFE